MTARREAVMRAIASMGDGWFRAEAVRLVVDADPSFVSTFRNVGASEWRNVAGHVVSDILRRLARQGLLERRSSGVSNYFEYRVAA